MNRFSYETNPNYHVKTPKLLYIDRYGRVFPDCKTYKSPVICHITDRDALEKINESIFEGNDGIFNMITVELSSICNANCFYCFQNDDNRTKKYAYYDSLLNVLNRLKTYWLFFSGGEILVQQDAMDFIFTYKKNHPDTWIHLKSNGNTNKNGIEFVDNTCDSVMVSFNGFSKMSYDTIMGLDINKTLDFCKAIKEHGKVNLGVKLLNSPITIADIPYFLQWALEIKPKFIALQVAYNYEIDNRNGKSVRENITLFDKDDLYWKYIYLRVSNKCKKVLESYEGLINSEYNYLTADRELFDFLDFGEHNRKFRTDGVYVIE